MKLKAYALMSLIMFSMAAYAGPDTSTDKNGVILAGHDAVAYFTENKPVLGSEEFQTNYNGATYLFSSAENRDLFTLNPEQYAPQFGGYCSFGTAQGGKFAVDGKGFKIVDNKLYVNKSPYVHSLWLKDESSLINRANENWKELKDVPVR